MEDGFLIFSHMARKPDAEVTVWPRDAAKLSKYLT
jgi:hypothetical protein